MANVLVAAHSYTLIAPNGRQKTVVKRGHSIDNLDEADQRYLATKSVTPPTVDDSHAPIGRMPMFHPRVDADVRGQATVEQVAVAPTPNSPYATDPVVREQVTVSVGAAPVAEAPVAAPAAPVAEAPVAPPAVPPAPPAPAAEAPRRRSEA